jgi:hypothetical protein
MENNILPQTSPSQEQQISQSAPKTKISILGVFLTFILAIVLVTLGERILFDLNKSLNPYVETVQQRNQYYSHGADLSLKSERSALSNQVVYYQQSNSDKYLNFKILINAGFIVPIFLLMFLIYYQINVKRKDSHLRVVSYGYLIFSIWMIIHLVINIIQLAYREFPQLALYLILIFLAVVFTVLAVFIQKKVNQHK